MAAQVSSTQPLDPAGPLSRAVWALAGQAIRKRRTFRIQTTDLKFVPKAHSLRKSFMSVPRVIYTLRIWRRADFLEPNPGGKGNSRPQSTHPIDNSPKRREHRRRSFVPSSSNN